MSQFNAFAIETYADSPTQAFIRNMRLWMQDFAAYNALLDAAKVQDNRLDLFYN